MDQTEGILRVTFNTLKIFKMKEKNIQRRVSHRRTTDLEAQEVCDNLGLQFVSLDVRPRSTDKTKPKLTSYVNFVCLKHSDKGIQSTPIYRLRKSKYGCKYCAGKSMTTTDFIKANNLSQKKIRMISEYEGYDQRIELECLVCSYRWSTIPGSIRNGSGCPLCGDKKRQQFRITPTDQFIDSLHNVWPNIDLLSDKYMGSHKKAIFTCTVCNYIWESYPANLLNKSAGCPRCRSTSNEMKIAEYLKSCGYEVVHQKRFSDCKDSAPLPFDIFLPRLNLAIEYDGEQHYKPIRFSKSQTELDAIEELKVRQRHDFIKTQYCKEHNIPLIRIPYWERNNIPKFLQQNFSMLGYSLETRRDCSDDISNNIIELRNPLVGKNIQSELAL